MTSENEDYLAPLDSEDSAILNEPILLREAEQLTGIKAKSLSNYIRLKRLQGYKRGRDLYTSRAWLMDYFNSKHQGQRTDLDKKDLEP